MPTRLMTVCGKLPLGWEWASFEPGSGTCSLGALVTAFSSLGLSQACSALAGICIGQGPQLKAPAPHTPQRHGPELRPAPCSTHHHTSLPCGLSSLSRPGPPSAAEVEIPQETGSACWSPGGTSSTSGFFSS